MNSRALRILGLLFVIAWFGVFAPAHQRGMIPVAGDPQAGDACCGAAGDAQRHVQTQAARDDCPPAPSPRRSCAVCQIIAALDVPPAITFYTPSPDWTFSRSARPTHQRPSLDIRLPRTARGPPVAPVLIDLV